jgi:plasmid stabilization system protein ParE
MTSPKASISPRAENDVRAIGRYIAERDGRARAEEVVERINKAVDLLALMPGIGGTRRYLKSGRRAFSVRPWLIVYRPMKDGAHVLRVLDGRRDLPSVFHEP